MLSFLVLTLAASGVTAALDCKCSPSDPCWPASSDWASLNETLSGHLIRTVPPAVVCYRNEPEFDQKACQAVLSNWTASAFHAADPASVDDPATANNSCNPLYSNGTSITGNKHALREGCSLGNYFPYVVNVTELSHVQTALKFAADRNLRVNIKNTGHGSIRRIWTHNLKDIKFHEAFHPHACKLNSTGNGTHMAATLGAGVQDMEMFKALAKHNAIAVGGTNPDVGVVGWATGGGHGLATGKYGMGADNIIEAVVVTPAGKVVTANSCQNEDLLWAIRGGGSGFGVILRVAVKAYPMSMLSLVGLELSAKKGASISEWYRFVAEVHKYFAHLQDAGVHGYYTMDGEKLGVTGSLLIYDTKNETINKLLSPIQRFADSSNVTAPTTFEAATTVPWFDLVKTIPAIESVGTSEKTTASRFIPRRAVYEDSSLFAKTLEDILSPQDPPFGVSNPSVSGTMTGSRVPVDNALNPAWRDSVMHLIVSQNWDQSVPSAVADKVKHNMAHQRGAVLRRLAPETGAYFNEASDNEPDWQRSFFGPHYPKLQAIKQKYDPNGLLYCHQCVGSELWSEKEDGKLCRA
ncbi:FAD-binding domain-containing protein [Aspergillus steynii IBT 23096]|uniref:FAD-binding domain-containing protein n=1 Tax=Aspergillus steynii IBT 23096 TaxID=1392250 RepID=A0A2I2GEZ0_9EURO|nr:FAD-binding domain-containing protein [Aspergillus steynii IBT 23096]PLB51463.1 FAD-binding domain-containing protein [Aspergillus steynii IBT 23096]